MPPELPSLCLVCVSFTFVNNTGIKKLQTHKQQWLGAVIVDIDDFRSQASTSKWTKSTERGWWRGSYLTFKIHKIRVIKIFDFDFFEYFVILALPFDQWLFFLFFCSGLAMLVSGIWVQIALHRYMELSTYYTNTFQIILVGTGLLILFVGTIACCCTVKAQPSLLYLVSSYDEKVKRRWIFIPWLLWLRRSAKDMCINYATSNSLFMGNLIITVLSRRNTLVFGFLGRYFDRRINFSRKLIHIQRPSHKWLEEGIESESAQLRTICRYAISGLWCDARKCKYFMTNFSLLRWFICIQNN
jgi:hypothetical protein